ncbi:MAG: hypothetical protein PHU91_06250 [Candidatus Omnitrophica bacterium]|nr:hypothetical protein [Candidatus Omnitrophota bacterium]
MPKYSKRTLFTVLFFAFLFFLKGCATAPTTQKGLATYSLNGTK